MRPSRADTSEPACTKRKMLSLKRRTSWPCSRKYSAMVRPERPTRRRAPGGSFICPKTSAVFSLTPDSGTAEEADLAALHVRSEQVDDLDPGLEDLRRRLQLFEARRVAVNRPAL